MELFKSWIKEDGPRLEGSRDLDSSKLQSPCIVRLPSGVYRLFYTAVGPAKALSELSGVYSQCRFRRWTELSEGAGDSISASAEDSAYVTASDLPIGHRVCGRSLENVF